LWALHRHGITIVVLLAAIASIGHRGAAPLVESAEDASTTDRPANFSSTVNDLLMFGPMMANPA
jgi:hypothetical protein